MTGSYPRRFAVTTTQSLRKADVYQQFLDAFNDADYDRVSEIIDPSFEDHHPGFEGHGRDAYLSALRTAHETLRLRAVLSSAIEVDDKIITRCHLTGAHVGAVLGIPATGRKVRWSTVEIWRVRDGKLVERWAEDDLLGLRNQLAVDAANVALIHKLNNVVNEQRYEDMDELFDPSFVDNNPAWSVRSLDELKDIIRRAKEALAFTSHHDQIYAADNGRVVIHVTFAGHFVGPFLGQQPTGAPVSWTGIEVYRIENNRIMERWVQADTAGLMNQLGIPLPE
jgi:predicted ester cyclase